MLSSALEQNTNLHFAASPVANAAHDERDQNKYAQCSQNSDDCNRVSRYVGRGRGGRCRRRRVRRTDSRSVRFIPKHWKSDDARSNASQIVESHVASSCALEHNASLVAGGEHQVGLVHLQLACQHHHKRRTIKASKASVDAHSERSPSTRNNTKDAVGQRRCGGSSRHRCCSSSGSS